MKTSSLLPLLASLSLCVTGYAAESSSVTIPADGHPGLQLQLPAKWSSQQTNGVTVLIPEKKYPHIQVWNVKEAGSLEDATARIAEIIKPEVTEFKVKETRGIKTVGDAGKLLIGTGLEADDMDPSKAEVYLIPSGGKVFLLIAHGEGDEAAKIRENLLKVVQGKASGSAKSTN